MQAVIDNLPIEAPRVFFPCNALFCDGERNLTIAQQACADVMGISINPENVSVFFRHQDQV